MVELCHRTLGGRRLLRPIPELTLLVLGVLGRALTLYPVRLHAFVYLSNHAHLLLSVAAANILSAFECHLKANTARVAKQFVDWDGPVWTESDPICVLDDLASLQRLRYILSNSVKEGLVESPLDWPGASGAAALLDGRPIDAVWRSRRTSGRARKLVIHEERCPIELTPLPCWAHLSAAERGERTRSMIEGVVDEAIANRGGRPVLGLPAILAADPLAVVELDETPPPICHTTDPKLRAEFIAKHAAFNQDYRASARRQRMMPPSVAFPVHAFPPAPRFHSLDEMNDTQPKRTARW